MSRKSPPPPLTIGSLIDGYFTRRKRKEPLLLSRIRLVWPQVVGPLSAARSYPHRLRDGTLVVAAADSTWVQELTFLRQEILDKLRQRLDAKGVTSIRLIVRPGAETRDPRATDGPAEDPLERLTLSPDITRALDDFEERIAGIDDPDLRRQIRRAFLSQYLEKR